MDSDCRYLSPKDFEQLYHASQQAFSDYLVPITLTAVQFENHLAQNAVDLTRSVGAFSNDKMIGYTLNGFGLWNGKQTAYDAGTGVLQEYRNKGVGTAIFEFLIPRLREDGVEQVLLEVVDVNHSAVALYRKLGFRVVRNLLVFEAIKKIERDPARNRFTVREIMKPEWGFLKSFWDGTTSWQFSPESVERKQLPKVILGVFSGQRCVGYGILNPSSGQVSQIAVDKEYRRKGIASTLLYHLQDRTQNGTVLRFSNVDENLSDSIEFLRNSGFKESFRQFEMVKTL